MKRLLVLLSLTLTTAGHASDYQVETIAQDLDYPWSIAFLSDDTMLVTELSGQLRRIAADGTVSEPLSGVPEVYFAGQGGLFDVLPDPGFENNGKIYLSFSAGPPDANATTVVRATLDTSTISGVETVFSANPTKSTPVHYGGRLAWASDGSLLITTGDGFDLREHAQARSNHFGKTIRINPDGTAPAGNPFSDAPLVFSYGHRNPQGLAVAADGRIFQHEHGPRGGDEINLIEAGRNYGWPAITYGVDYNGAYISPYTEYEGMEQPVHDWTPSIGPSGLMIYEGDMFPEWQGDLFAGALIDGEVRHLAMDGNRVTSETAVFPEINARIRDVRQSPDGSIFVVTDGPQGAIYRVYR